MRKLALLISTTLLVMLVYSCSKDDDTPLPTVSFAQSSGVLNEEDLNVTLNVQDEGSNPIDVPVKISGTAVKDQDYTISGSHFSIGEAGSSKTITIAAKDNYNGDKEIVLELVPGNNYLLGANSQMKISLIGKEKITLSFEKPAKVMATTADIIVNLTKADGSEFIAQQDMTIPVVVDTAKSTAVNDVDFGFTHNSEVSVKQGESFGKVGIRMLTDEPNKESNVICLTFPEDGLKGFTLGKNKECQISMIGNVGDRLVGKWKMKAFDTNKQSMDSEWQNWVTFNESDDEGFPKFNADDYMIFNDNGTIETSFKSTFKNYFAPLCNYKFEEVYKLREGRNNFIPMVMLELDHINRYFSKNVKSEDDKAFIGLRFTEKGAMKVYLLDYTSKSFAPEWNVPDAGMYEENRPTAIMRGMYILFTLEKVEE